jgi:ParB family transcriptional regulator, chromosome partitioning protein
MAKPKMNFKDMELPGDRELKDTAANLVGKLEQVAVNLIDPNPDQPRQVFDEEEIAGLAASIEERGLGTPILLQPPRGGRYVLVAGERRLRAFKKLGRPTIPAFVTTVEDPESVSMLENIQRVDLGPVELSTGLAKLMRKHATQEDLARVLGKSVSYVSRVLAIQDLPAAILAELHQHRDKLSQAKLDELVSVRHDEKRALALWEIVKSGGSSLAMREAKRAGQVDRAEPDAVARTLKRVDAVAKELAVIRSNSVALDAAQRKRLRALHDELGALLSGADAGTEELASPQAEGRS